MIKRTRSILYKINSSTADVVCRVYIKFMEMVKLRTAHVIDGFENSEKWDWSCLGQTKCNHYFTHWKTFKLQYNLNVNLSNISRLDIISFLFLVEDIRTSESSRQHKNFIHCITVNCWRAFYATAKEDTCVS